jgi:hypothetical protein
MFLSSQSRIVGDAHRLDGCDAVMRVQVARRGHTVTRRTQLHHSWQESTDATMRPNLANRPRISRSTESH